MVCATGAGAAAPLPGRRMSGQWFGQPDGLATSVSVPGESVTHSAVKFSPGCLMPVFRIGHNWSPLHDLERQFDDLLRGMDLTLSAPRYRGFPQLRVLDCPEAIVVEAQVPGVDAEQIEVTTSAGTLTLRGERCPPPEATEQSFRRQERFHGVWQRSVQIPDRVREDEVTAAYVDGVLTINLPKAASSAARQIQVTGKQPEQ
jgi:HSP20 family protein